jgi:16S rRNA (adenine1518-N6/adenine1519-N6)-dimethyltransferase
LKYPEYKSYKVVANLPYYITTPVIINFLESEKSPSLMILMMQREVAERIMADPGGGDYGSLSVFCQYYCHIEKVMNVSPGCFFPEPDVTSSVLKMSAGVSYKMNAENKEMFFSTVRSSFAQRRKKVSNSIANTSGLGVSRQEIEEILTELGLKKDIRAERLTIADFKRLSFEIGKIVK